jgi:ADP-heptose:LPS heptosyltransferase
LQKHFLLQCKTTKYTTDMKFLVIRFSSIGDIVLTSPVLRLLKARFPEAEIHYVTKKQNAALLACNPRIDKVHLLEDRLAPLIKTLQRENYDYIIDLHHNLRSLIVRCRLGKKSFVFRKLNLRKWLSVNFKMRLLPPVHVVERYIQTLQHWDVRNDGGGLEFYIPGGTKLPDNFSAATFVALVLGAKHNTKKIPHQNLMYLCQHIRSDIVLLGGQLEFDEGERLSEQFGHVRNYCGAFDIYQSAKALQSSALVITSDTGLMHIAAAFGKDIFSLWGSTVPEFGMYPYLPGEKSEIFEVKSLKCRPCSKIGYAQCPQKHFDCMAKQDLQRLAERVNQYITDK